MDIKTLLVHLDDGRNAQARVATAAALAERFDAHLLGVAPTSWILPAVEEAPFLGMGLTAYQDAAARALRERAQACVAAFEAQAAARGLTAFEGRVELGDAETVLSTAARYADLTVMTQAHPDEAQTQASARIAQAVLLQSGRPLLLLPFAGESAIPTQPRVLAAWNGSREAARALHDALPLMQDAASVEVVVFETPPDLEPRYGELPGADIGLWLARHGLNVKVSHVPVKVAAGEALLSHAADMGAQLIVAGGWGHSRLREAVLGGVTRTLMRSSPVPVLLSH
ncbi:MAG: universal stress protein [Roseateles sp.]